MRAMQAEVAKLRAELRRTTEERDILKKAAAYFAKQSG
jgi:transposase